MLTRFSVAVDQFAGGVSMSLDAIDRFQPVPFTLTGYLETVQPWTG